MLVLLIYKILLLSLTKVGAKREYMTCQSQNITKLQNTYKISLVVQNKNLHLCMFQEPQFFSSLILDESSQFDTEFVSGSQCKNLNLQARGYIVNSCFYGKIYLNQDTFVFLEDPDPSNNHSNLISVLTDKDINMLNYSMNSSFLYTQEDIGSVVQTRSVEDKKKNNQYCNLILYMTESFVKIFKAKQAASLFLMNIIHQANDVLTKIDFSGPPGDPILSYNIKLYIISIKVVKDTYVSKETTDPSVMIERFNHIVNNPHDQSCVSAYFSTHNWGDVKGMAYLGTSQIAGMCGTLRGVVISVNNMNENIIIGTQIVLIHEFGHVLGSIHDNHETAHMSDNDKKCMGDSVFGKFVMNSHFQAFSYPNTMQYSPCSINRIKEISSNPNRRSCLQAKVSYCGNGIIDSGEDCDSGPNLDKCCSSDCKLSNANKCSPFNGECCSDDCKFIPGHICQKTSDCNEASICTENSQMCPNVISKNEGGYCMGDLATCLKGKCEGSVCMKHNYTDCITNKKEDLCKIMCEVDKICQALPKYIKKNKVKGTPCNNQKGGICMDDGVCWSPIFDATVSNFLNDLISGKLQDRFREYYKKNTLIIVVVLALTIFIFPCATKCLKSNKFDTASK